MGGEAMSEVIGIFVPAELVGNHYRAIGGGYATVELAVAGAEDHFRNGHGGGGSFRVFRPDGPGDTAAIVEASAVDGNPMAVRAIYKVLVSPTSG